VQSAISSSESIEGESNQQPKPIIQNPKAAIDRQSLISHSHWNNSVEIRERTKEREKRREEEEKRWQKGTPNSSVSSSVSFSPLHSDEVSLARVSAYSSAYGNEEDCVTIEKTKRSDRLSIDLFSRPLPLSSLFSTPIKLSI
jgi:glycine cleavage system aminomethyltransferase T